MVEPRKEFRIERMAAPRREPPAADPQSVLRHAEIMQELAAVRGILAAALPQQARAAGSVRAEPDRLRFELRRIRSAIMGAEEAHAGYEHAHSSASPSMRIAKELEAAIKASEQATQRILAAAERIDRATNTLTAALDSAAAEELIEEIRNHVIAVFEACNFQDLTSQRLVKVKEALARIEHHIGRTLDETARDSVPPMHGPRLERDQGHASQSDVDAMFADEVRSA